MSISKVKVSESHERLMLAIGETIRIHTQQSPMPLEGIVGVLAFCSMAVANIDFGIEAVASSMANTSLILPEGMQ